MSQRLNKRTRSNDKIHEMKECFVNDTYGWNSFVNAVHHGRKFKGRCDEFAAYRRRVKSKEAYLEKLWAYHNKTNLKPK